MRCEPYSTSNLVELQRRIPLRFSLLTSGAVLIDGDSRVVANAGSPTADYWESGAHWCWSNGMDL